MYSTGNDDDSADPELVIAQLRAALADVESESPSSCALRLRLAELLVERFVAAYEDGDGRTVDLTEVIEQTGRIRQQLVSHEDWLQTCYLRAVALDHRRSAAGDPADLDEAIGLFETITQQVSDPDLLLELVDMRFRRQYPRAGADGATTADDLTRIIAELDKALECGLPDDERVMAETKLGIAIAEQLYGESLEAADARTDRAIDLLTRNLRKLRKDNPLRHPALCGLAQSHQLRYFRPEASGIPIDPAAELDTAINFFREMVKEYDDIEAMPELQRAVIMRYLDRADPADRDLVLHLLDRPIDALDPDEIGMGHLAMLAQLFLEQAREQGTEAAVEAAVVVLEGMPGTAIETLDPGLALTLVEGYASGARITLARVDREIAALETMLGLDSDEVPDRATLLAMLCFALTERAVRTRLPADRERARRLLREQTRDSRDFDWTQLALLALLGMLTGTEEDPTGWDVLRWPPLRMGLDFSPELRSATLGWLIAHLDRIPSTTQGYPDYLAAIGLLRADLVPASGSPTGPRLTALRLAVTELESADNALNDDDPLRLRTHRELGSQCAELGRATNAIDELRRGATLLDEVLADMPAGHPLRAGTLSLFGTAVTSAHIVGNLRWGFPHAQQAITEASGDPGFDIELRAMCFVVLAMLAAMAQTERPERRDMAIVVNNLRQAVDLLPRQHPDRAGYRQMLASALLDRYRLVGDLADAEAAREHLADILSEVSAAEGTATIDSADVADDLAQAELLLAQARRTDSAADQATRYLRLMRAQVAEAERTARADGHQDLARLITLKTHLAVTILQQSVRAPSVSAELLREAAEQTDGAARLCPPESALYYSTYLTATIAMLVLACMTRDRSRFDEVLLRTDEYLERSDPSAVTRAVITWFAGSAWLGWWLATGDDKARDAGIEYFERSRRLTPTGFQFRPATQLLDQVADAYWARGRRDDIRRSVDLGLAALRDQAREVVLQSSGDHAVLPAADAARRAAKLMGRCLSVGLHEDAVRAVEAGRGLVLHAASSVSDILTLLRERGHRELADEWVASLAERGPAAALSETGLGLPTMVPSDLRHRVLEVLSTADTANVLAALPSIGEIAGALRALDLDALAYLMPADGTQPGRLLLITANGEIDQAVSPRHAREETERIAAYLAARRAAETAMPSTTEGQAADAEWARELDRLCDWAEDAVMAPLRDRMTRLGLDRIPRIALVAMGELCVVPWHAARRDTAAGPRRAVQDFALCCVSSARQLCVLAGRSRRPVDQRPVLLADPTGTLVATAYEFDYLRGVYPKAVLFGTQTDVIVDGAGTVAQVLGCLPGKDSPGASMVHFGAHACSGPTPSACSLELADGEHLTVATILRHAQDRPAGHDGGLVVLAACRSSLTEDTHDEALTLSSAFVAAGATGVTGTLWVVPDLAASVLMCLYHRQLSLFGRRPLDALRAVQLWALDPRRVLPADFPVGLATGLSNADVESPVAWAAFTHCGW